MQLISWDGHCRLSLNFVIQPFKSQTKNKKKMIRKEEDASSLNILRASGQNSDSVTARFSTKGI